MITDRIAWNGMLSLIRQMSKMRCTSRLRIGPADGWGMINSWNSVTVDAVGVEILDSPPLRM
jgi:hypothetical protein